MQAEINIGQLSEKEYAAVQNFVREAHRLWVMEGTTVLTFEAWLNLLTQGIHEALVARARKRKSP